MGPGAGAADAAVHDGAVGVGAQPDEGAAGDGAGDGGGWDGGDDVHDRVEVKEDEDHSNRVGREGD